MECSTEDLKHHQIKIKIKDELNKRMKQWEKLKEDFHLLKSIIDDNFP